MKKHIIRLLLPVLAVAAAVSCSEKTGDTSSILEGEWKLTEMGGIPVSELANDTVGGLDIYVAFYGNGSFETFQRLMDSGRYVRYSGTFTVSGDTANGTYDDGVAWGAPYTVRLEEGNSVLVMTANGEDCVYGRQAVPEDVRANAVAPVWLKSGEDGNDLPPRIL